MHICPDLYVSFSFDLGQTALTFSNWDNRIKNHMLKPGHMVNVWVIMLNIGKYDPGHKGTTSRH